MYFLRGSLETWNCLSWDFVHNLEVAWHTNYQGLQLKHPRRLRVPWFSPFCRQTRKSGPPHWTLGRWSWKSPRFTATRLWVRTTGPHLGPSITLGLGVTRSPFWSPTPLPVPCIGSLSCQYHSVGQWGQTPGMPWATYSDFLSTKAAARGPPACSWIIPLQCLYSLHTPAYRQKPLYLPTTVSMPILVRIYLSGLSEWSLKEWGSSDAPHTFSGAGA